MSVKRVSLQSLVGITITAVEESTDGKSIYISGKGNGKRNACVATIDVITGAIFDGDGNFHIEIA